MVENPTVSEQPTPTPSTAPRLADAGSGSSRKAPIGLIVGAVLVIALIITGTVLLLRADNDTAARVRDVDPLPLRVGGEDVQRPLRRERAGGTSIVSQPPRSSTSTYARHCCIARSTSMGWR